MRPVVTQLQDFATVHSRWHQRIDAVHSVEEMVDLTRDYLARLAPEHFARLPEDCRPVSIKCEDDIDYWAYQLASRYKSKGNERIDGSLLHELTDYFLHALIRATQLHRRGLNTRSH